MKILKHFMAIVLFIGVGIATWFFYPQYQIYKLKKQAIEVHTNSHYTSYLNYFRQLKTSRISHLAIGDSVIRGFGADENNNLVSRFSAELGTQINKQIEFKNEGINGITSTELNLLVQQGKFDSEIKNSEIVTINVGGNDILQAAANSNIQSIIPTFNQLQSTFLKNLTEIAARINKENPNATVMFLELYNPLPPSDQLYPVANKLLPKWNLNIYKVAGAYPNSVVVETTKVINGEKPENLSHDGVHPNSAGYSAISNQMVYQLKHSYRKYAI